MSYTTINQSAQDPALVGRVTAAAVQEAWNNPAVADTEFAGHVRASASNGARLIWPVCIADDVAAAYASALAAENPNPGGDDAVITDGMILANVQAKWPMTGP
jgi:hypothetical protein